MQPSDPVRPIVSVERWHSSKLVGRQPLRASGCTVNVTGAFAVFGNDITLYYPKTGLVYAHLVSSLPETWKVVVPSGLTLVAETPNPATFWSLGGVVNTGAASVGPMTTGTTKVGTDLAIAANVPLVAWQITDTTSPNITTQAYSRIRQMSLSHKVVIPNTSSGSGSLGAISKPYTASLAGNTVFYSPDPIPQTAGMGMFLTLNVYPADMFSFLTPPTG